MFNKLRNKGRSFEDVVEEICKLIAEDERLNAKISKRIPLIGLDKATHEFDILYEYEHFGIQYRVAIECKNWNKAINKSQLTDFAYKLRSVGNINGIFLSESKLQKGAALVSEYENIKFIKYSDFRKLSLSQNEKYLIPNFRTIGDPFWMFMNLDKRNVLEQNLLFDGNLYLFESKYYAKLFQEKMLDMEDESTVLVGITQKHLKDIRAMKEKYDFQILHLNPENSELGKYKYHFSPIEIEDLNWFIR
ncbi:restriction endonuclease [Lysinibacillus sphaericus]|uniref:restriction endonuclease n=1 Tax=Lysinibacillus sphaericus TaxID=1421 RepID=UPI003F79F6F6